MLWRKNNAAILMYHSIVDHPTIAWTQIRLDSFRHQMEWLARNTTVFSMNELSRRLTTGDIPRASTVVTFDDGYANFASLAVPVLEEFEIPATVYLTTSFIDGQNAFEGLIWPDYVHSLFMSTRIPALDLGKYSLPKYELLTDLARHKAQLHLCNTLKRWPTGKRISLIKTLPERLETILIPKHREMFASMTWSQVRKISQNPLIDFGAHTVSHVILTQSSNDEMRHEILQSKRDIEDKLNRSVKHFAYPNGSKDDFDNTVLQVVRSAFDNAVTTIYGLAASSCDKYKLPRLAIGSDMFLSKFKLFITGIMKWA